MLTLYPPPLQIPHQTGGHASHIEETLQGVSITDSDVSAHETDSDEQPDSEYCYSDYECEERDHAVLYIRGVYAAVEEALSSGTHQTVVAKINKLRRIYKLQDTLTASFMLYGMMQTVLRRPYASEEEVNHYIEELFVNWKDPLKHFTDGRLGEVMLINKLEKSCSEMETPFSPFSKILTCLYNNNLVRGHAILFWACKDRDDYGSYETLLNQSHDIIKMLKESINDFDPERFFACGEFETESEKSESDESESEGSESEED